MDQLHRSFLVLLQDVQVVLTQRKFLLIQISLQVFYISMCVTERKEEG
jgi:hypothetical protein